MKWTNELPIDSGFYFYRNSSGDVNVYYVGWCVEFGSLAFYHHDGSHHKIYECDNGESWSEELEEPVD